MGAASVVVWTFLVVLAGLASGCGLRWSSADAGAPTDANRVDTATIDASTDAHHALALAAARRRAEDGVGASCALIDDLDLRFFCSNDCSLIHDRDAQQLCAGQCSLIDDHDLRFFCSNDCSLIHDHDLGMFCSGRCALIDDRDLGMFCSGHCGLIDDRDLAMLCR